MNSEVAISTSLAVTTGDGDDAVSFDRLTASAITVLPMTARTRSPSTP